MQKCNKLCTGCGRPCNEICSEPCKCGFCDRRSGGMKVLIKPLHTTSYPLQQSYSSPSFHTQPAKAPGYSGSTPGMWKAYANGGAKAEDIQFSQKQQENAAKFQDLLSKVSSPGKLIKTSPKKKDSKAASTNTGILIDLGENITPSLPMPQKAQRMAYKETFSYAGETRPANSKMSTDSAEQVGEQKAPAPVYDLLD